MDKNLVCRIGFWSAILVTVTVLAFALFLIIGLFGPDTSLYSFISCFILAPSFVALMAANHYYAAPEKKIWSLLGLSFAVIYAVFITMVYYLQIAVVQNTSIQLSADTLKILKYMPGTAIFALDMLGYAFMSLATLFVAFIFGNSSLEKWIKRLLIISGLFFLPSLIFPALPLSQDASAASAAQNGSIALLFWCALFSAISILMAVFYKGLLNQLKR